MVCEAGPAARLGPLPSPRPVRNCLPDATFHLCQPMMRRSWRNSNSKPFFKTVLRPGRLFRACHHRRKKVYSLRGEAIGKTNKLRA